MRSRAVLAVTALGVLTLTGCSLQPGVGVAVGDETVSNAEIDRLTTSVCDIQAEQLAAQQQVVPLALLKANVASALLNREVTEQAATAFGVEPDETYEQSVAATREQVPVADADELDDYVELVTTQAYTESIIGAIGQKLAVAQDLPAAQSQQAGAEAFTTFVEEADIEVDPRYGFSYDGAQISTTGALSSVPASEQALLAGDVTDPGAVAEYAASLPPDLTCGG